jgi:hypothetical protein
VVEAKPTPPEIVPTKNNHPNEVAANKVAAIEVESDLY